MTTAQLEQSPSSLIREAMETIEDPAPDAVARVVIPQLTPQQLEEFAIRGIAEDVRQIMSRRRKGAPQGPTASSRWGEVARQNKTGELEIARIAIFTGVDHKWLPECTPEDLMGAVAEHERQAKALRDGAAKLERLAEMVKRKRGAKTVGDLDPVKVEGVLSS